MMRTAIMLPDHLKLKAEKLAASPSISLGELIRESLEEKLATKNEDPFFSDTDFYIGQVESDLSKNHDKYLYS